jgi:hypothetical protein
VSRGITQKKYTTFRTQRKFEIKKSGGVAYGEAMRNAVLGCHQYSFIIIIIIIISIIIIIDYSFDQDTQKARSKKVLRPMPLKRETLLV